MADLGSSTESELDQSISEVPTPAEIIADSSSKFTIYQSQTWKTHLGYYKTHNPSKGTINKLGSWAVGKGFKADEETTKQLERIKGLGKDTFNEIINNQVRVRHIDGDSYAEIVGGKGRNLSNLKPMNPGRMKSIWNEKNMLIGYSYTNGDGEETPFKPKEIFHLTLNRTANSMGGTGDIESITGYLDKIKQMDEDMAVFFHRFVVPAMLIKLNTDNVTKIAAFKTKMDKILNKGQNLYTPMKSVEVEVLQIPQTTERGLEWRKVWVDEIIRSGGVPALIMAQEAGTTEASSKMVIFTWEQVIEDEQMYVESQIKLQLGLEVEFEFPARIEKELATDERKDGDTTTKKESDVKA